MKFFLDNSPFLSLYNMIFQRLTRSFLFIQNVNFDLGRGFIQFLIHRHPEFIYSTVRVFCGIDNQSTVPTRHQRDKELVFLTVLMVGLNTVAVKVD
ncbi:hypothetical protein XENTR_v10010897 [Xenopus tropicalis]|nr:hypothetical protein XENTR_v10010897 [Xenopus tropicalis]